MDTNLMKDIERLQVQVKLQEDPEDADVSSLPPLTADSDTLGRELRDALSDLLLARQQSKSLRDSLRRKEEQNELMRKVNEQVQTVQQKLVAKEAELTRTHEESVKLSNELRAVKGEKATEQGQLEMLQWKLSQRDTELLTVKEQLSQKALETAQLRGGQQGEEDEWARKLSEARYAQREGAVRLMGQVLHRRTRNRVMKAAHEIVMGWQLRKSEKAHQKKMKKAKLKVEENIKQVQQQVSKVMDTCRQTEADNVDLKTQLERAKEELDEELNKNEDLTEQLENTEEELAKLLEQLGGS